MTLFPLTYFRDVWDSRYLVSDTDNMTNQVSNMENFNSFITSLAVKEPAIIIVYFVRAVKCFV